MNPYVDLCLSIQAIRRDVERLRTPIATALGVAANVYTHQISNTHRVLTDVRVRHLLADEVGLGKTIQALMIINALKCFRPKLRVLIIVPDRLVSQWRDEIFTRAHTTPKDQEVLVGEDDNWDSHQYIRLAWEDQIKAGRWSLSEIDSEQFDVLVVDELHKLTTSLQDRIVRQSPMFEHVLVLTATPEFQQIRRHAELFAILEPERTSIARWGNLSVADGTDANAFIEQDQSQWTDQIALDVVQTILERDRSAKEISEVVELDATALCHCAYRRVIRTRRVDFDGILPRRRHIPIVVQPFGDEIERQALMWRYFEFLDEISQRVDPVLLAKRVVLSPPSLEQRVDFFRRRGFDRDGLLEAVKPLVHRSNGDSRADALIDLLSEVWSRDSTERVLVAAQDNLTVDYLYELTVARLPLIGPLTDRIPLVAARIRQGMATDALDDIAGYGNETSENLELFQRGDAHVLFAPEAAQVGLNLQCARVLVLYSVPWRPEEVEQWIGRLDRIGNIAAFQGDNVARTIDVYTIAQKGLVDEKVVTMLERFRVFEHGVNLDGDHLEEVSSLIESAALRPQRVNWMQLEAKTESMALEDSAHELESALRPHLPWGAAKAMALKRRIDAMPPVAPTLVNSTERDESGTRSWDRAFEATVRLLRRSAEYNIRRNNDPSGHSFYSLWYQFGEPGMYGAREVQSRVIFSCGANPSNERRPRHAHAFIMRRGDIETPPRRSVTLQLQGQNYRRPLRFLNFGDQIHDEFVAGWLPTTRSDFRSVEVQLFSDHEFFHAGKPGIYVIRLVTLVATEVWPIEGIVARALEMIQGETTTLELERLAPLARKYERKIRCALEADLRWLSAELPAELKTSGFCLGDEISNQMSGAELALILNPLAHGRNGVPLSSRWEASAEERESIELAIEQLRKDAEGAVNLNWRLCLDHYYRQLSIRLSIVKAEAFDALELRQLEMRDAEKRSEIARARGNQGQITRAENELAVASCIVGMERVLWAQREAWLVASRDGIRDLKPRERLSAALRVRLGL